MLFRSATKYRTSIATESRQWGLWLCNGDRRAPLNTWFDSFLELALQASDKSVVYFVMMIDEIRIKIASSLFEFSKHAVDQSLLRRISVQEAREAIETGEIIADYPNDKYGPSCLILGWTIARRPLHVQCSYPSRPLLKIITLYEPDAALWINFKERKSQDAS